MDEATRALIVVSAALGTGGRDALAAALDAAHRAAEPEAVEEVLLQSFLFVGYPGALNGFALWRERSGRPAPPPAPNAWAEWRSRGEAVCSRVYAGQYPRLRINVARLHPDMERWMLVEGYGKVLGRPGLALRVRELCIAALLAGQDAAPQLHSHLRGALNVGASPEEVAEALDLACGLLTRDRAEAARSVWAEVRRRWEERGAMGREAQGDHVR